MKKVILTSLLSSSLLLSQASNAGEWAIGGLIGQSSADEVEEACDIAFFDSSCDDTDTSIGINISYHFNNVWGIEAGYVDFGEFGGSEELEVEFLDGSIGELDSDLEVEYSALYLAGTGTHNFNDKWSITGRAGIAEIDIDATASVVLNTDTFSQEDSFSDDDSSTELFLGASINYNFNKNLQAQLRYDYFDADIDAFSFGLKYSFGK